jgi:hypothetical protein
MSYSDRYNHSDRIARKTEHILLTDAQHATEYRLGAAEWVRSIITSDHTGRWYPFILNSIRFADDVADRADYYRRRAVIRACETATKHLSKRAKGNPKRQHPVDAVRVIYLPAVKHGSVHLHGWCRIPKTDTNTARLYWKEQQYGCSGDAPSSLVRFSTDLCARLATKNIWWNLDEDKNLGSVAYAQRVLKREKREWGMVELQPAYLFEERVA